MKIDVPSITNFSASIKSAVSSSRKSYTTNQLLRNIGNKVELDTDDIKKAGLQPSFRDFDVNAVTPQQLGLISKNLFALGYIDKMTAHLLLSAGTSLDAVGNQTHPNIKMNALDYFSARIGELNSASSGGDEYGFFAVPDFIKAVHVLMNLDDFAKDQPKPGKEQHNGSVLGGGVSIRV